MRGNKAKWSGVGPGREASTGCDCLCSRPTIPSGISLGPSPGPPADLPRESLVGCIAILYMTFLSNAPKSSNPAGPNTGKWHKPPPSRQRWRNCSPWLGPLPAVHLSALHRGLDNAQRSVRICLQEQANLEYLLHADHSPFISTYWVLRSMQCALLQMLAHSLHLNYNITPPSPY
jgi:hypothetical protein